MLQSLLAITGLNKYIWYALAGLAIAVSITAAIFGIRKSGADAQKTKTLQDTLNNFQKEAKNRAKIESMSTSAARDQLRKRWSKK